jgi:hypothetical protein
MPQPILEKRTRDDRVFDVNCSQLLDPTQVITGLIEIDGDIDGLTFGSGTINPAPISYPDGTTAPTGKVLQVEISGGSIPIGASYTDRTLHFILSTSTDPVLDATVVLRLKDTP